MSLTLSDIKFCYDEVTLWHQNKWPQWCAEDQKLNAPCKSDGGEVGSDAICWGTALQDKRFWVWFPVRPLEIFEWLTPVRIP